MANNCFSCNHRDADGYCTSQFMAVDKPRRGVLVTERGVRMEYEVHEDTPCSECGSQERLWVGPFFGCVHWEHKGYKHLIYASAIRGPEGMRPAPINLTDCSGNQFKVHGFDEINDEARALLAALARSLRWRYPEAQVELRSEGATTYSVPIETQTSDTTQTDS